MSFQDDCAGRSKLIDDAYAWTSAGGGLVMGDIHDSIPSQAMQFIYFDNWRPNYKTQHTALNVFFFFLNAINSR